MVVPESAKKLHGQCVGMAVLWAGQMSFDLGELKGTNFELHQSFVYLFNRHGGYDFLPLRSLPSLLSGAVRSRFPLKRAGQGPSWVRIGRVTWSFLQGIVRQPWDYQG